jgi:hypothetical protein
MPDVSTGIKPYKRLFQLLRKKNIEAAKNADDLAFTSGSKMLKMNIPADIAWNHPEKITAIVCTKLGLNHRIFARKCEIKKISRELAENFLNEFHIMGSTQSAWNYGLFYKYELLAVASFSKGRKMNRLPSDKRSYELIRFCCKPGYTITGGLSRLVKNFFEEKSAGDIMTYVDKQFSSGQSFIKAGFLKAGETEPNYFLVNKKTFERRTMKDGDEHYDAEKFYRTCNEGNIKMIYKV